MAPMLRNLGRCSCTAVDRQGEDWPFLKDPSASAPSPGPGASPRRRRAFSDDYALAGADEDHDAFSPHLVGGPIPKARREAGADHAGLAGNAGLGGCRVTAAVGDVDFELGNSASPFETMDTVWVDGEI